MSWTRMAPMNILSWTRKIHSLNPTQWQGHQGRLWVGEVVLPREEHTDWWPSTKWSAMITCKQVTLYALDSIYLGIYRCIWGLGGRNSREKCNRIIISKRKKSARRKEAMQSLDSERNRTWSWPCTPGASRRQQLPSRAQYLPKSKQMEPVTLRIPWQTDNRSGEERRMKKKIPMSLKKFKISAWRIKSCYLMIGQAE